MDSHEKIMINLEILDFLKLQNETKIKNLIRISYIEDNYNVVTNGFFLTYPQTEINSEFIEIVYLHLNLEICSLFSYEIRRSQVKLASIENLWLIQEEKTLFAIDESDLENIVKMLNSLANGDNNLTNFRKIINQKKSLKTLEYSTDKQCLHLELTLHFSNILLIQKKTDKTKNEISTDYFAKIDIISYIHFLNLSLNFILTEKKNDLHNNPEIKLYNILTRIEKRKNFIKQTRLYEKKKTSEKIVQN